MTWALFSEFSVHCIARSSFILYIEQVQLPITLCNSVYAHLLALIDLRDNTHGLHMLK